MLFAAAATLAIVAALAFEPGPTRQILVPAPLVAILDLPHGALDLPIDEALRPLHGWRCKLRSVLGDLSLAAVVIDL